MKARGLTLEQWFLEIAEQSAPTVPAEAHERDIAPRRRKQQSTLFELIEYFTRKKTLQMRISLCQPD